MTSEAGDHAAAGRRRCSPSRKRVQVRSPTASDPAAPHNRWTSATGSSVSPQGRNRNTPGRSITRGASSAGTTSVASPSTGTTSMVSRSSGIAS